MDAKLIGLIVGFAVAGGLFWTIEALAPAIKGKKILRTGFRTDLIYWFFTPLITRTVTGVSVGFGVVLGALALGSSLSKQSITDFVANHHGLLSGLPLWAQAIIVIVAIDFIGYWMHRWFHKGWAWKVHAVHHSSKELDWLSSVRLHPLNSVITRTVEVLPFFVLGFDVRVLAGVAPLLGIYGLFLHANVKWDFGLLRYVIATPKFHRWHHTSEQQGLDKNFSGLFPVWDLLFGTWYMPANAQPEKFGVLDEDMPEGVLGQMAYPFRRAAPVRSGIQPVQ